jgi:hypothetical protein
MKSIVKLMSVGLCSSPSLLTWAIHHYGHKPDRPKLRRVFTEGYGLTDACADDLLSGRVPFNVENGDVTFEYESGKAQKDKK